jgi:LCP family protein required for cell wall assembly
MPPERRRRASRRRRAIRAVVCGVLALLLLGGAGAAALYLTLSANISEVDIDAELGRDRPPDVPDGSLDILVLGSDSRAGANRVHGRPGGERADTAMVVHLHEHRKSATIVSIPRDTLVSRPACPRAGGGTEPAAERTMFNESFTVGGPACAVKTVEAMTGMRMDHYLEVDFHGFEKLVDALGGVEVTLAEPIRDSDSKLDLTAGTHRLDGEQSLALVRTRKSVGDGSDLGRIQLQHAFIRALADEVRGVGVLSSPRRLYAMADTATSAVTTDSALASVSALTSLARTLRGIGSEELRLATLPVRFDEADPNRVVPLEPEAERVWRALRADRQVPAGLTEDAGAGTGPPADVLR